MTKEYWWISVGGGDYEPAVVTEEGIFTFGCSDPFKLDDPTIKVRCKMEARPLTPEKDKEWMEDKNRREVEWNLARGVSPHRYRQF
jgi:hypothetical protein